MLRSSIRRLSVKACFAGFVFVSMIGESRQPGLASPLDNLDFEQGAIDSVPPGWNVTNATLRRGYRVTITSREPHGGRACAEIARDSIGWATDLGAISKRIDARPYRGKRMRLSGWIRYAPPPFGGVHLGAARLYVRVDRERSLVGFFDDQQNREVKSVRWTAREIDFAVAADAETLAFGGILSGSGRAGVDDLSLEVTGVVGEGDQPAAELSSAGTDNLVALARLVGYVRHFHPSDEAAATDWDAFTLAAIEPVEAARGRAQLAATLERLFRPVAPTVRIATRRLPPLDASHLVPAGASPRSLRGWVHLGWGDGQPGNVYSEWRSASADSILPLGAEKNVSLGGGVWCSVPLTLPADSAGTLPRAAGTVATVRRPRGWIASGNDRATRLAAVILFWNVAQHFYPYFDVVGEDWPALLPPALKRAARDRDGDAFQITLEQLVARLHDGHGNVNSGHAEFRPIPVAWSFVGDQLIVTRPDSTVADLIRAGDEVVAIDDRAVADCVREAMPRVSGASPQHVRLRLAHPFLARSQADSVSLDLRGLSGPVRRVRVPRGRWGIPTRPDSVAEPGPGVIYLNLSRISDADFERELPRLTTARGIVFDMRGYPRGLSPTFLSHLIDTTITSARWNVPIVRRPDREDMGFVFSNWPVTPKKPRIPGRVAFLIDASALSYSETLLGIVEHYRLAELVGEATAGTNGNIVRQRLPGGYTVIFTGMKVLKHDGSRHHGIGILPTVPVLPTRAGIAAGRDEQLEKAIEVVNRPSGGAGAEP